MKKVFSLLLSIFLIIPFVCFPVNAASDHVYYSQYNWEDKNGNGLSSMCYFTSFAMIVTNLGKRVTPVDVYYANGSMRCDFDKLSKYYGLNFTEVSLYTYTTESEKRQKIITALESGNYPAGILVCGRTSGTNHMVVARKVVNGVIYCDDPARGCCIPIDDTARVSKNITSYKAFTKGGAWGTNNANSPTVQTPALSSVKTAGTWYITVPANYKLLCYSSDTAMTSNGVYIRPQSSSYRITCIQKSKLSNGTTRYYAAFNNSKDYYWFKFGNGMSVESKTAHLPSTYTVTFNSNGGSVNQTSKTVTKGSPVGPMPTPTRDGYTFLGWSTAQEGSGMILRTGEELFVDSDMTLYAVWKETTKKEECTVVFLVNDGSSNRIAKNVWKGDKIDSFITPVRNDYNFFGWSIDGSKNNIVSLDNFIVEDNLTLYAVWEPISICSNHVKDTYIIGSSHPHEIFYTCSICGEVFTDGSTVSQPDSCSICLLEKIGETATTIVPVPDPEPSYTYWGPWSDWSSTRYYSSDTREIETRQVKTSDGYTEYRYGRYIDGTGGHAAWCADYLAKKGYSGITVQYTSWSTSRYNTSGNGWTCGFCNGNHVGVDHYSSDGRAWWAEYVSPRSGSFFWEESRQSDATYEIQYRYRDLILG